MTNLSTADLEVLEWIEERKKRNRILYFKPYPKQADFFEMGATKRERLLMAGNQLGKTEAGAVEATYHLTGKYPAGWKGRKWERANRGWAVGESSLLVRDVQQKKLCGEPGVEAAFGTGFIPADLFVDRPSMSRGVTDAYDTIQVRHVSGGVSVLKFKSYEQGRKKMQGDTVDWVWCDEEPPEDIYGEVLTRVTATKGMVWITFTPLQGRSNVVNRFLDQPTADRGLVKMTIFDAAHISPEERVKIIAGYAAHERDARASGVPMMGSGRIFPYADDMFLEPAIPAHLIPPYWRKLWGVDFGIDHPFGAALVLHDADNDVLHVHHTIRVSGALPLQHAEGMKRVAAAVPVAWPHDGGNREKGSGEPLAEAYRAAGLRMLGVHSTWPEGGYSIEGAITEIQERIVTGRFKIASHLTDLLEEIQLYHRKDGLVVPVRDDLISAIFKVVMMKRYAVAVPLGSKLVQRRRGEGIAAGLDFDYF